MSLKQINAGPTKAFFVSMLTRDIDLKDAILDLLDNCVDGVLRELAGRAKTKKRQAVDGRPYEGYWAKIVAKPDRFEVWDNCGGITQELAEKSAFMLGRPDLDRDAKIETVGMYGIGMKRAIFKLGRRCTVTSQPDTGAYKVEITPEWLGDDQAWTLQLDDGAKPLSENGTKIVVSDLHPAIQRQFDERKSSFIDDLKKEISRLYAQIIEKGFVVTVNGKPIAPVDLHLLIPKQRPEPGVPAIEPYVFVADLNGVRVDLAVGFYRPLAKEKEIEEELTQRRTRDDAGWTVVCNDRVVLHNDKSMVTGWGTGGVPSYHNQFICIAGIVSFRSCDSLKLPLNTTKRGLDTSSEVYLIVLEQMREGLKKFTSFTNRWKRREEETDAEFETLQRVKSTEVSGLVPAADLKPVQKFAREGLGTASRRSPVLPEPPAEARTRRVVFSALQEEIELVADHLFGDPATDRSEVGRRCFDEVLEQAKER
jgi:hypothetical protein